MKKILVVDDNHDLLRLIELRLTKEGYSVSLADNGATGLEIAMEEKPHAIILDIMMPEMDGWEFCERARAFTSAPILMLTAKSQDEDVVKGLQIGADDTSSSRSVYRPSQPGLKRCCGARTGSNLL